MFRISIPKPCLVGWENMQPNERGRYCSSCTKTVIDFSVLTDEEVQHYFIAHHGEDICGRFKNSQLQTIVIDIPEKAFVQNTPFWKKFLIACLLIFGTSVFPFEATLANTHANEYYQINQTGKKENKKKARFLKKKKKYSFRFRRTPITHNIEWVTLGFSYPIEKLTLDTSFKSDTINNTYIDTIKVTTDFSRGTEDKKEPTAPPADSTEFIIPPAVAGRRTAKRKK